MAKKKDTDLGNFNLDDFDFNFDIPDNPKINTRDRNPVVDAVTKAGKGFKSTVGNRSFLERVVRKAMPKDFMDAFDQADRVVTDGRRLYNGVAQDVRPAWRDFDKATRDILPVMRQKGNHGLANRIEKMLGKQKTVSGAGSSYNPDNEEINTTLLEVFKAQADDQAQDKIRAAAEDQLKQRTDGKRHTDSMNQLTLIGEGINNLVGYERHITNRYQRKMLELNYRQYYAQRDILESFQIYAKDTRTQLEAVIKNTALPDILKQQASEQFMNQARQRMFGKVQQGVGDYFRNYTTKLTENIGNVVNEYRDQLVQGLQAGAMGVDAARMGMEFGDGGGVAGLAGKGGALYLGHRAGNWMNRLLARNERVRNGSAKLGYGARAIPEFLNSLGQSRQVHTGLRGQLMEAYRRVAPGSFRRETGITRTDPVMAAMGGTGHSSPMLEGYLSRILQSLESTRLGREVGRVVYNREQDAFTTQRERTSNIGNSILGKDKIQAVHYSADAMIERMDPERKLSPSARSALKSTLMQEADKGNSFDPAKLGSGAVNFKTDRATQQELTQHLRNRYNVTTDGKLGEAAENYHRASLDLGSFNALRRSMPDVYASIHRVIGEGGTEDLRALGILKRNTKGQDEIDYSFIQKRLDGADWSIGDNFGPAQRQRVGNRAGGGIPPTSGVGLGGSINRSGVTGASGTGRDFAQQLMESYGYQTDRIIAAMGENSARAAVESALVLLEDIAAGSSGGDETTTSGARTRRSRFSRLTRQGRVGVGRAIQAGRRIAGQAGQFAHRTVMFGPGLVTNAARTAMNVGGMVFDRGRRTFDVYVVGQAAPALTKAKMEAGEYFDLATGAVIHTFADIKGAVKNAAGDVVLTEDDIRSGLRDKFGKPIAQGLMRGLFAVMGQAGSLYAKVSLAPVLAARWGIKQLTDIIAGPEDIYVPGETSPRLLAVVMRRGGYYSKATRKVIKKPSDIDGEIIDLQGNTVLSADDIQKGLVDKSGKAIAGLRDKILLGIGRGLGLIRGAFGLATRTAKRIGKFAWDRVRSVGRGVRGFLGGIGRGLGGINVNVGGNSDPVVRGLEAIYELLNDRLPAGQPRYRKGSWQEKYAARDNQPKKVMERIKQASDSNPLLKYLMMFGGAVMAGFGWLKSKLGGFVDIFLKRKGLGAAADIAGDAMDGLGDGMGRRRRGRGGLLRRGARGIGKVARVGGRLAMGGGRLLGRVATGAGRLAISALPFAGEMLAGAAALITAPVAIAGAAIAGVAVAGYFAYKYFKGKADDLQRLRMAGYGFDPSDRSSLKKVIELEGYLADKVRVTNGEAALAGEIDPEEIMKRCSLDTDDASQMTFAQWFARRFKPVFLRNTAVLHHLDPKVKLVEISDHLDKSQYVDFAVGSRFPSGDPSSPYAFTDAPWKDAEMISGTASIDKEIDAIKSAYGKYRKADKSTVATTPAVSGVGRAAQSAVLSASSGPGTNPVPPVSAGKFQASTQVYETPSAGTSGYEPGIAVKNWSPTTNRMLDDLTAIRMRIYGLTVLDINQVNALTTLETAVQDQLVITNNGKVSLKMSPQDIYKANAGVFGRNPTDAQGQAEWVSWFTNRFLPVYSQFVSALWAIDRNIAPGVAWKYLKPDNMLSIAELLKGVKTPDSAGNVSVWGVKVGPFAGMDCNGDISTIDGNLLSLRNQLRNDQYKERKPGNAANQSGTTGSNQAASGNSNNSGTGFVAKTKSFFKNAWSGFKDAVGLGDGNKQATSGWTAGGTPGSSSSGGAAAAMGTPIAQPGNGTGGDINQIPMPTGDGSWDALKNTIVSAALMAGVDPALMASMAFVESNFKAAVRPGTSAAQGLYQFIPSTWQAMLKKYAKKYGIDPNTSPSDPRANALMGAEYLKENQQILESKLGRPVTGTDLYLSHFLGSGGGPRLLKAPSGDLATQHVDASAARANPTVFYSGGRPKTVGEIIAWANKRIEGDGGRFATDAKATAAAMGGRPPVAANDANASTGGGSTTSTPAPNLTSGSGVPGKDDGGAAFAANQASAASFNATPSPNMPRGADGPSDVQVSAAQTQARSQSQDQAFAVSDQLMDLQRQQLASQQESAGYLKQMVALLQQSGGLAASSGGITDVGQQTTPSPAKPDATTDTTAGAKPVGVPISMRRRFG